MVVARRAPAAPGGPDPRRVSAAEVERHALPGWLADSEPLGEWTLRAGGGFTGRANSCHAVGDPGLPVAAAAERIVAYAARHGIAPMAMVVTGSAEEQALRDLGWVDTYVPTEVLAARLADVLGDRPAAGGRTRARALTDAWLAAYARSRPLPADRGRGAADPGRQPAPGVRRAGGRREPWWPSAAVTSAAPGSAWPRSGSTRTIAGPAGRRRS